MIVRHLHDPLKRSETFPIYFFWVIYAAEVPTTPSELGDTFCLSIEHFLIFLVAPGSGWAAPGSMDFPDFAWLPSGVVDWKGWVVT